MNTAELDRMLNKFVRHYDMPSKYPGMDKPFKVNQFSVATDGKAMLLLKDHELKRQNDKAVPDITDLLKLIDTIPDRDYCKLILISNRATFLMDWCDSCDCIGCDDCDGKGYDMVDSESNFITWDIGEHTVKFNVKYLNWLDGLRNTQSAVSEHAGFKLIVIKHEHGFCIIMGCN